MFSYWLGLLTQHNLRNVGDGNPGAANLWKASGFKWGILGVLFDFSKGYLPLILLIHYGKVHALGLIVASLAPIAGHILSPFLKGKGGKGTAVTFGVWSALSHFELSVVYAVILAFFKLITTLFYKGSRPASQIDSLHAIWGFFLILSYLIFRGFPSDFLIIWLGNWLLILYSNIGRRAPLIADNEKVLDKKEESPLSKSN